MISIKALIIYGFGINCEKETALAFRIFNIDYKLVHLNELISDKIDLNIYHIIVFPGGFSFADELGAGRAFANKLKCKSSLEEKLAAFVDQGKCILGICNGFQILSQLGFFSAKEHPITLKSNRPNMFINKWVKLKVCSTKCVFLKGIDKLYLPIRHAEGRFFTLHEKTIEAMIANEQIALRYDENPNGSLFDTAGVCDKSGRVFGLMPHPEAALFFENLPNWTVLKEDCVRANTPMPLYGPGIVIFENALNYLKEKFNGESPNLQCFSKCYG